MTIATGAAALAPSRLLGAGSAAALYSRSIVIDGLGFPGGRQTDEHAALLPLEVEDVRASGLTAVHVTVGAVGTMSPLDAFDRIVRDITRWEGEIERRTACRSRRTPAGSRPCITSASACCNPPTTDATCSATAAWSRRMPV